MNDKNEVACHFYGTPSIRKYPENFYTLMHETIEPNESLEEVLARGLKEEFSMEAALVRYVGSLAVRMGSEQRIEKTVVYFLCRHVATHARNVTDPEAVSEIRWVNIDNLVEIMKEQGKKYGPASDESKILIDVRKSYILAV